MEEKSSQGNENKKLFVHEIEKGIAFIFFGEYTVSSILVLYIYYFPSACKSKQPRETQRFRTVYYITIAESMSKSPAKKQKGNAL